MGGLAVVVNVVHLAGGRVGHLPAGGQVGLVSSKISSALHVWGVLWGVLLRLNYFCLVSVTRVKVTPLGVTSYPNPQSDKRMEVHMSAIQHTKPQVRGGRRDSIG